jgi:hypothetical protein
MSATCTIDIKKILQERVDAFIPVCKNFVQKAQDQAQANAPWEDKTGDARKLLKGYAIDDDNAIGFCLAHRVDYGKYLETANNGDYAILEPTVESLREPFLNAAREAFGGGK